MEVDADTAALNSGSSSGSSNHDLKTVTADINAMDGSEVSTYKLTNISATLVEVIIEEPRIFVINGTSFLLLNVTRPDGLELSRDEIQKSVWNHTVNVLAAQNGGDRTINETLLDEVTISNFWTNKTTNITRFTISYTYENASYLLSVPKNLFDNFNGAVNTPKHTIHSKVFYENIDGTYLTGGSSSSSENSSWLDSDTTTIIFAVCVAIGLFIAFAVGFALIFYFVKGGGSKKGKAKKHAAKYETRQSPCQSPKQANMDHYGFDDPVYNEEDTPQNDDQAEVSVEEPQPRHNGGHRYSVAEFEAQPQDNNGHLSPPAQNSGRMSPNEPTAA